MNVWGYIRVSTDGQLGDDKFGLDAQKSQIEKYCRENDHEITKWISDEGESGARERPGFDNIIYSDLDYPCEAIVVAKSDRVARDINVYYYYKMMLNKKDIKLISIAEDFGSFGIFASMLEAFTICVAEMERDNIKKRTSAGRYEKAARGGFSGGRVPLGYDLVNGELVVNKNEAEVVKFLFDEKAVSTYQTTADALNRKGYKTKSGKKWTVSSVQGVMRNEDLYKGMYTFGDMKEPVKGKHEAII